jgi:pimeloyl-ACP methyl ester carboxylesterase
MHVVRCGSGDPILFIHGMPTNGMLWKGVIAHLCKHYACFAVDLPGMGSTPSEAYDANYLRHMAEKLDQIRIANGIEKWHVVGHDAGSVIAVHYARYFPEHVDCMALMSPPLFPELKPFFLLEALRKPILGELLAPIVGPIFWKIAMHRALASAERGHEFVGEFQKPFKGLTGPWVFMRILRWGNPARVLADVPEFLPKLQMPTLVFHGSQDEVIPEEFARRASMLMPNASMVTVESGHFIPLHQPEPVAARLSCFFGDRSPKADFQAEALVSA